MTKRVLRSTTGALIREYVWLEGQPIAVIEGGVISFVRADHIGRPVFATNSAGAKVWTASYLPFGGVRTSTGTPSLLRFPGQWFQSESGLHQNWMRDYDPTTGRYIEADPLGLVDGASIYGYARQNPGRYDDPTGQCIGPLVFACAAVAGFAVGAAWTFSPSSYGKGKVWYASIGGKLQKMGLWVLLFLRWDQLELFWAGAGKEPQTMDIQGFAPC